MCDVIVQKKLKYFFIRGATQYVASTIEEGMLQGMPVTLDIGLNMLKPKVYFIFDIIVKHLTLI